LAGGVPWQGVVVQGVKGVKDAPMPPGMYENSKKTGSFAHFLDYKSPKTPFFSQNYLTRYIFRPFSRNTLVLKFFITLGTVELYLFKVTEIIYAPSHPDQG
jgi:hypothetical protein